MSETLLRDPPDGAAHTKLFLLLLRFYCAGQRSTPHYRTLEVRPGRIKLELKYDYDCERGDTNFDNNYLVTYSV